MKILGLSSSLLLCGLCVAPSTYLYAEPNDSETQNKSNASEAAIMKKTEGRNNASMDTLVQDALMHQNRESLVNTLLMHSTDLDYFYDQIFPKLNMQEVFLTLSYIINADHLWPDTVSELVLKEQQENEIFSKRLGSLLQWSVKASSEITKTTWSDPNQLPRHRERLEIRMALRRHFGKIRKEERERLVETIEQNISESVKTDDAELLAETVFDQRDNNRFIVTEILNDLPRKVQLEALIILLNNDSYWLDQYTKVMPEFDDTGLNLVQHSNILYSIQGIAMQIVNPEAGRLESLLGPDKRRELRASLIELLQEISENNQDENP